MNGIPRDLKEDLGIIDPIVGIDAIPKDLPGSIEFPVGAMPEMCQPLIKEGARALGCPPEMIALPMLAALGSAIGNSRRLVVKPGWEESATVYAAVIAEPGAKKTPAQALAVDAVMGVQGRFRKEYLDKMDQYKQEMRDYEVDRKHALKAGESPPPEPERPTMRRTVVGDTTVEALVVIQDQNPRGVLANYDELSGWVRAMDQYKSGGKGNDRQYWLSCWSNRPVQIDRKGQAESVHLTRPFHCVIGSVQPDVLPELHSGREDGMLDRFLFAYPKPTLSLWTDDSVSSSAQESYAYLWQRLWELDMGEDENGDPVPRPVMLDEDAQTVFIEHYNEHITEQFMPGFPRQLKNVWSKLEAYLARLSLILALCRARTEKGSHKVVVTAKDVVAARGLLEYFKNQAYRVFVSLDRRDDIDLLAADVTEFLLECGGSWEGTTAEFIEPSQSKKSPQSPPVGVEEVGEDLGAVSHVPLREGGQVHHLLQR